MSHCVKTHVIAAGTVGGLLALLGACAMFPWIAAALGGLAVLGCLYGALRHATTPTADWRTG